MTIPSVTEDEVRMLLLAAVEKATETISESARSWGSGTDWRQHMEALLACLKALDAHADWLRASGVNKMVAGSSAWPLACALRRDYCGE